MLAGKLTPDNGEVGLGLHISVKPQKITPKYQGTVEMLFIKQIKSAFMNPQFNSDVMKPMLIDAILDHEVQHLSGGELQRVAIVLCLGKPADIYLLVCINLD